MTQSNLYFYSFFKKAGTIIFGLLSSVVLNRSLGPTFRGQYSFLSSIISIIVIVLNLGISVIYPNYYRRKENWVFPTFVSLVLTQFIIYLVVATILVIFFKSTLVGYVSVSIASGVAVLQLLNITVVENYPLSFKANILSSTMNFLFLLMLWLVDKANIETILLAMITKDIGIVSFVLYSFWKNIKFSFVRLREFTVIIRTGFIPMVSSLLVVINYRIDIIMLRLLEVSYLDIGLYTVGLTLAEYAWIMPDIFKDVLINKTAKSDDIDSVSFSVRMSSTMLLLTYIVYLFFGKYILTLLYGYEFGEAYKVTNIIFIGVYGMIFAKLLGTLFLAQGKWIKYFVALASAVISNVILNLILITNYGIYGAALTSVLSYNLAGFIFMVDFSRTQKIRLRRLLLVSSDDLIKISNTIKTMIKSVS